MKSTSKFLFYIIFSAVLVSCSGEESSEIQKESQIPKTTFGVNSNFDLSNKIKVQKSTRYISERLLKMGVVSINVIENEKEMTYSLETIKSTYINDSLLNLQSYKLILKNNFLYIKDEPGMKLSMVGNKVFIETGNFSGYIEDLSPNFKIHINLVVLSVFLKEITLPAAEPKILVPIDPINNPPHTTLGCPFMNTITKFYAGSTRSIAVANAEGAMSTQQALYELNQSLIEGGGNGVGYPANCKPIGGIDSGCVWEDYGCVASFSMCCK